MYKNWYLILIAFLVSCSSAKKDKNNAKVIVHLNSDAQMLNPVNYSDANSEIVTDNIFQTLLHVDRKTLEIVPVLALSRPIIERTPSGEMLFRYKIRPEARWDNGEQITARDVEFSLKAMICPNVNNYGKSSYFEFLEDIKFDEEDPLAFTLIGNNYYMLAEISSGGFPIIPEYIYDPQKLLKEFSISQLIRDRDILINNSKIISFANEFNSEKYQRYPTHISGSGPYSLMKWETGQQIIITKKENWWGDLLKGTNTYYEADAKEIVYKVIPDQATALTALKSKKLDVSAYLKAKDFIELQKNKKIASHFNFYSPLQLEYNFIGLNTFGSIFSDKKTRQAFAHLIDINKIIEVVHYGLAEPVVGPIHPSRKHSYNNDIIPYEYDLIRSKELLSEAGWKDSDQDGILDKKMNGKKIDFSITLMYNSGNEERKALAIILQEEARKAGIRITIQNVEASVYFDIVRNRKFDAYIGAWGTTPFPEDFKPTYHTSSIKEGANYTGFGTIESDSLIDVIRIEMDENERNIMYRKLQEIMHDEAATLFLFARSNKIVVNKKFSNSKSSLVRPGFWAAGFSYKL